MSIRFITGLPGHGKSLLMVRKIAETLLNTKRTVVTTLTEIDRAALYQYLQNKAGDVDVGVHKRLFFIEKKDTGEFYRFRGAYTLGPAPQFVKTADTKQVDATLTEYFSEPSTSGGVDYFITEAHRHFKADRWDTMSDTVMYYCTQHRHFDDNVWIESQLPKQVVVQLRDLCDECVEMRNLYRERFGFFKKPGCFRAIWYYSVPTKGSKADPFLRETFLLDKEGIASCYATRGAIVGTGQPETQPPKRGLPFWTMFVFAGVGVVSVPVILTLVFKGVNSSMASAFGSGKAAMEKKILPPKETEKPVTQTVTVNGKEKEIPTTGSLDVTVVTIDGMTNANGKTIFYFSDGTAMSTRELRARRAQFDNDMGRLTLSDGSVYYVKKPKSRVAQ